MNPPVLIEKWTHYTISREGCYFCWTAVSFKKKLVLLKRAQINQSRQKNFLIFFFFFLELLFNSEIHC